MSELRIYIAGKMEWQNEEDSKWVPTITDEELVSRLRMLERIPILNEYKVKFIFPQEVGFDHGGDLVNGIVEEDIRAIENADAIIAIFSEREQNGTVVELLHALHSGKKALVIFTDAMVRLNGEVKYPVLLRHKVALRGMSNYWWFLINYLLEEFSDSAIIGVVLSDKCNFVYGVEKLVKFFVVNLVEESISRDIGDYP